MKRDFDLMRMIALRLQDAPAPLLSGVIAGLVCELPAIVDHHIALMLDLQLVKEVIPDDDGDDVCLGLTNLGHDFISMSCCSEADWGYALDAIDHLGGTTFETLMHWLCETHKRRFADAFVGLLDRHDRSSRTAASA